VQSPRQPPEAIKPPILLYPTGVETADPRAFGNADRTVFVTVANVPGFLPRTALIEAIRRAGLKYTPARV